MKLALLGCRLRHDFGQSESNNTLILPNFLLVCIKLLSSRVCRPCSLLSKCLIYAHLLLLTSWRNWLDRKYIILMILVFLTDKI